MSPTGWLFALTTALSSELCAQNPLPKLHGFLLHADESTLSIQLNDERIIRVQVDRHTRYTPASGTGGLTSFHLADVVEVELEINPEGPALARSVRFSRKPSPMEHEESFRSPESTQAFDKNLLLGSEQTPRPPGNIKPNNPNDLLALARRRANDAFERLPDLRAKQRTSMFRSASEPKKWIPEGVITFDIAYRDSREVYEDLQVDGRQRPDAPPAADSEYMNSLNKAWSTGDFRTISYCVLSELPDSDFRRLRPKNSGADPVVTYEFSGPPSSNCIGIKYRSQVTYPSYRGSMTVREQTGEVLHAELQATHIPAKFPLDRAERSVDFETVEIGEATYLVPVRAYWFGCYRNSYACFINRIDYSDYHAFQANSTVAFR